MDKKEDILASQTKERKSSLSWNKEILIFIVLPIILIILVPLGGLPYLCGRLNIHMVLVVLMAYPAIGFFIIFCFFAGIIGLLRDFGKQNRVIITHVAEIIIPIVFVEMFIIPFFIPNKLKSWCPDWSFIHGFRDRIRSKADIPAIRDWLKTLDKEDYMEHSIEIYRDEWPESLKVLNDGNHVVIWADRNGNPQLKLTWGAAIFHWGVTIGMENMEMAPSDFEPWAESWLLVEPGVYVWDQ